MNKQANKDVFFSTLGYIKKKLVKEKYRVNVIDHGNNVFVWVCKPNFMSG